MGWREILTAVYFAIWHYDDGRGESWRFGTSLYLHVNEKGAQNKKTAYSRYENQWTYCLPSLRITLLLPITTTQRQCKLLWWGRLVSFHGVLKRWRPCELCSQHQWAHRVCFPERRFFCISLTLILLTWRIWWAPNNASKWQMGFNLVFKGLNSFYYTTQQDFGTRKVYCVSNVTFHAEPKYTIKIFPSPTVFVQWPF